MSRVIRYLTILALIYALAGCAAGKDFARPDAATLRLGQTTYAQAIGLYGEPRQEGATIKNDKTVRTATYAYSSAGGRPAQEGVTATRAMTLFFFNDILVGYQYLSSWAEDHTDFDESKLRGITKGKTTEAEVTQLLGKPAGHFIHPLIKESSGRAAVYAYAETRVYGFRPQLYHKALVVTFDASGVVTDIEFSAGGTR